VNIIAPRDYSEGGTLEGLVLESMVDMGNDCGMDFQFVHKAIRGQIENPEINSIALDHYDKCDKCKKLSKLRAYFS
jgi:hypothetical protein